MKCTDISNQQTKQGVKKLTKCTPL